MESRAPAKELKHTSSGLPASQDLWPPALWRLREEEVGLYTSWEKAAVNMDADGD